MHLKVILLPLCHPELINGYLINIFMVRAPGDHSFNPLSTENTLKVLKVLRYSIPVTPIGYWTN